MGRRNAWSPFERKAIRVLRLAEVEVQNAHPPERTDLFITTWVKEDLAWVPAHLASATAPSSAVAIAACESEHVVLVWVSEMDVHYAQADPQNNPRLAVGKLVARQVEGAIRGYLAHDAEAGRRLAHMT